MIMAATSEVGDEQLVKKLVFKIAQSTQHGAPENTLE